MPSSSPRLASSLPACVRTASPQARQLNEHVFVVGPNPNLRHLSGLGVTIEGRDAYKDTFDLIAVRDGGTEGGSSRGP